MQAVQSKIKSLYNTEKIIAVKNKRIDIFDKSFLPFFAMNDQIFFYIAHVYIN